jgi:hypothetical protein
MQGRKRNAANPNRARRQADSRQLRRQRQAQAQQTVNPAVQPLQPEASKTLVSAVPWTKYHAQPRPETVAIAFAGEDVSMVT